MAPRYGIGAATARSAASAPPTNPGNGSGGAGSLLSVPSFTSAQSEISDITTGQITLGVVNLTLIGLIAFYLWTRSNQGG